MRSRSLADRPGASGLRLLTLAALTLAAYASGVFPMPLQPGLMGWWSPVRRGLLPLDGLKVSRSLRKMLPRYEIRVDTAWYTGVSVKKHELHEQIEEEEKAEAAKQ